MTAPPPDHVLGLYAVLVPRHAPLGCAVMDLAMCLNTVLGLFQDKRKLPWEQQEGEKDLEAANNSQVSPSWPSGGRGRGEQPKSCHVRPLASIQPGGVGGLHHSNLECSCTLQLRPA